VDRVEPRGSREVVGRLARCLDADDFAGARALLADDCLYRVGDEVHRGPEAILASYRAASARAHALFDEVRYQSEVESTAAAIASVTFTDYLFKVGCGWHRHRCRQEFTVGADGRVVGIVHREIPGEREALDVYLRKCGIER
jgi:hypothetical protein